MHIILSHPDDIQLHLRASEGHAKGVLSSIIGDRCDITWNDQGFYEMHTDAYVWLYSQYQNLVDNSAENPAEVAPTCAPSIIKSVDVPDSAKKTQISNSQHTVTQTDCKVFKVVSTQTDDIYVKEPIPTQPVAQSAQSDDTRTIASILVQPVDEPVMMGGLQPRTHTPPPSEAESAISGYDYSRQPFVHWWNQIR